MKRLLLGRIDLILFVVAVAACGLIVQFGSARPFMLGLLAMPIFVTAALSGVRERFSQNAGTGHSEASNG